MKGHQPEALHLLLALQVPQTRVFPELLAFFCYSFVLMTLITILPPLTATWGMGGVTRQIYVEWRRLGFDDQPERLQDGCE